MENFRRSLKYLWPYRGRITVALVCTILIAGLWGGGLGLVLPGAKILIAEEGLHGWAYRVVTEDHLGAKVVEQDPLDVIFEGKSLDKVLNVVAVDDKGSAGQAGIKSSNWIVGVDGEVLRAKALLRRLSEAAPGQTLSLLVHARRGLGTVQVTMSAEKFGARALKRVAGWMPEPKDYRGRFPLYLGLLAAVLVVTVLRAILTFIQEYLVGTAIWLGTMDLRCANYNKVLHLPTTFFSEKGVSDATSRFIQDTNELARGQNTLLGKTMVEPAKAIGSVILAFSCSWELTLLALLAGPPAFFMIRRFGKKMHKASRRALESWSSMLAVLSETLMGIRVVKAYTMEGSERRRFFRVNRALVKQQNRKERLDAATGPTVEALGIAAGMVAAGIAGYQVFNYAMSPELFITWMAALFAMFDPVRKLAKVTLRFHESDAAAKRIFELRDTPEEPFVVGAPPLRRHTQSIEFRDVSYRYPGTATDAVKNASLAVRAGQTVAIVGPNGSGKTTLLSLLPRLIDPAAGKVLIDGYDISQVSVRSLRRQIGLVSQDAIIFHATLAENIAYGLRRPKQQDVLAASRKAFVDEFVQELPAGYDTLVGEQGATLSGGQRQRISIARAILRDPAILIFDEAMSQIDSDSERRIHQAMSEFCKGRTTLLIAHRFATVLSADMIVVMNGGAIIDIGSHEELLKRCELYEHLYKTQFRDSGG